MRILQVSRHHWSYAVGGTEAYLRDLVVALRERGHDVPILTFQARSTPSIEDDPASRALPLVDEIGEARFRMLASGYLDKSTPTVAHFHSVNQEELVVAEELRRRRIPCVATYHQPGLSCHRGDLLRWGTEICDGRIEIMKCAACRVASRTGMPRIAAYATAAAIGAASPLLRAALPRAQHAKVDYWASTSARARLVRAFFGHCARVIACADWSVDVLRRTGVDGSRLQTIAQGLPRGTDATVSSRPASGRSTVTVGFVGRICREKGIDVLVAAMRRVPHANLRLVVVGWDSDPRHPIEPLLRELSRGDGRIQFLGRLSPARARETYAEFDFVAVPSTWLETGPLVVWEALSHGVPVLASARIGHPALLDGGRGMIVEPHSVERWAAVLTEAAEGRLRLAVPPGTSLRTMDDVAEECEAIYASFPERPGSAPAKA